MKSVFTIYLKKASPPDSNAHAVLDLPASPYEVLDALDKLRLGKNGSMLWKITEYSQFGELRPRIDKNGSLYELNALAQRLSELDEAQSAVFAGLLEMEHPSKPIPLPRLIDLAHSTECCHMLLDALNDSQLGRIRAESGQVPGIAALPKETFEILDFEQIGRRTRIAENGVFVERSMDHPGGYMARHSPLLEVYKALDLMPTEPDYTMLLEVSHDCGAAQLKLPASEQELDAVPQALDEPDWQDLSWTCLDCKAPSLMDAVSEARDIHAVNDFAGMLAQMDSKTLVLYKALLEAGEGGALRAPMRTGGEVDPSLCKPPGIWGGPNQTMRRRADRLWPDRTDGRLSHSIAAARRDDVWIRYSTSVPTAASREPPWRRSWTCRPQTTSSSI